MEELRLDPLEESCAEDLTCIWSDSEVIRFTNIKEPCSLEEIKEKIRILSSFDVFVVRSLGKVIGIVGCPCVDKTKSQYGIFYQFRKESWGQGYATAATEQLLCYMKKKYKKITFLADVVAENIASEKILKRFGFRFISEESEQDGIKRKIRHYEL